MARGFFRNRKPAAQPFPEVIGKAFAAVQDIIASPRIGFWCTEGLLHAMDRIFRHRAMRGPLTTHDADETAGGIDLNYIVASQLLCIHVFPRRHEGAGARETT